MNVSRNQVYTPTQSIGARKSFHCIHKTSLLASISMPLDFPSEPCNPSEIRERPTASALPLPAEQSFSQVVHYTFGEQSAPGRLLSSAEVDNLTAGVEAPGKRLRSVLIFQIMPNLIFYSYILSYWYTILYHIYRAYNAPLTHSGR